MSSSGTVHYAREQDLDVAEFSRVLAESGLGATRPLGDPARLQAMLNGAGMIVTARLDRRLVGVSRTITDFSWCAYLAELAVSKSAQGLGVGRGLLDETRRLLGPQVTLVLTSMPDVTGFYERAEMARVPDTFWYKRQS
ncbi:MAG: GNAT family N-acetyltransferase [Reyranella sp.]|jgi:ribosomal protein S18 acetylase RimI-like enzyme|nr:MAG: GNAT family N-acetyltransferase [Reyranella sp.]